MPKRRINGTATGPAVPLPASTASFSGPASLMLAAT